MALSPSRLVRIVSAVVMGLCCSIPVFTWASDEASSRADLFGYFVAADAVFFSGALGWFWRPMHQGASPPHWISLAIAVFRGLLFPVVAIAIGATFFQVISGVVGGDPVLGVLTVPFALLFGWRIFLPVALPLCVTGSLLLEYVARRIFYGAARVQEETF